jgi:PadR family transcriptional regulator, regulatory protein PadR
MGRETNITTQTLRVLRPFLENPGGEIAGVDVIRSSRLASGTAYPIMLRLERHGLLSSRWEEGDPARLGRPRRRYYTITPYGAATARQAFAELSIPQRVLMPEAI